MFDEPKRRSSASTILSLAAHGALLFLAVGVAHRARIEAVKPSSPHFLTMFETRGGSHAKLVLPEDLMSAGRSRKAEKTADRAAPRPKDSVRVPEKSEPTRSQAMKAQNTGTGSGAATGGGSDAQDATPAFPIFSPKPPVRDRTLLPAAEQKVVVEVEVSPAGEVTKETLARGMGNALDQLVLDTVKGWKFQPATVNGTPVQSEAELIFPFDLRYPVVEN